MEPSSAEDGNVQKPHGDSRTENTLQWSRPQLRTETTVAGTEQARVNVASMEPSSAEDGNRPRRILQQNNTLQTGLRALQGSTTTVAAENRLHAVTSCQRTS